jgi:hypothetical protein
MTNLILNSRMIVIISIITSILLSSALTFFPEIVSADPAGDDANTPIWIQSYDGKGDDFAMDVATDTADNIIVGGVYWNLTENGWYYNIVKYDSSGQNLWERSWFSGWNSGNPLMENYAGYSISLATDSSDDIVAETNQRVRGTDGTTSNRYIIKYNSRGERLWDKVYENAGGQNIEGNSVAIDSDDNIISTGTSYNSAGSFADIIKYSPDGAELWHNQAYTMPNGGGAGAVAVDSRNNIIVCGQVQGKMWMIKYDSNSNELWRGNYPNIYPAAVVADSQDNYLFTGIGQPGATLDYCTTKYDTGGTFQWTTNFDSGFFDWGAFDIAIDSHDVATVVGLSYFTSNPEGTATRDGLIDYMKTADYCAITYDPLGNVLCKRIYNGQHGDQGFGVATDSGGNVILTGTSYDGATFNYVTVKFPRYVKPAPPAPVATPTPTPISSNFTTAEALQTTDQKTIEQTGSASIFALIITVLFLLISTFFNSTLKSNYSIIQGWAARITLRLKLNRLGLTKPENEEGIHKYEVRDYLEFLALLLINALISTFIKLPPDISGFIISFIPSFIIGTIITTAYAGAQVLVSNQRYQVPSAIRMYLIAILVATLFAVFTWVLKYPPILIYGFVGGYFALSLKKQPNTPQRARMILLSVVVILSISVISFYARGPVHQGAVTLWGNILDNTLAKLCCGGLLGLVLYLLPFDFMDGARLKAWNFWIWLITFYIAVFTFAFFVIIKDDNLVTALESEQSIGVYLFMGICILIGLSSWLFFRLRFGRAKAASSENIH